MAMKPPPRRVLLFHPRFWPAIRSGDKCQTIRMVGKRPVRAGTILSLRGWKNKPYRSKQLILGPAICDAVEPVLIEIGDGVEIMIEIAGVRLNWGAVCNFVRADGFESQADFEDWWTTHRYSPFEGVVIRWTPIEEEP
jgi:hypothetical protein